MLSCSFGSQNLPEISGGYFFGSAVGSKAWGHHGFHRTGSLPTMRMAPGTSQPLAWGMARVSPEEHQPERGQAGGEGHAAGIWVLGLGRMGGLSILKVFRRRVASVQHSETL